MASNDLFAPPTKDELAALPAKGSTADMFAPPTKDELAMGQPQQSHWYDVSGKGMLQGAINALPTAGMIVGGALGTVAEPGGGTILGAGAGAGAGGYLKGVANKYLMGDKDSAPAMEASKEVGPGMAAEMMGPIAGKTAESFLGSGLQDTAEKQAVHASGGMLRDFRALNAQDKTNDVGRYALDNGLVQAGDTTESIAKKAAQRNAQAGADLNRIYDQATEAIQAKNPTGADRSVGLLTNNEKMPIQFGKETELIPTETEGEPVTKESIRQSKPGEAVFPSQEDDKLLSLPLGSDESNFFNKGFNPVRDKSKIMDAAKSQLGDSVDSRGALSKLSDYLDDLGERYGNKVLDPQKANDIKGAMDQKVNYARNPLSKEPGTETAFHAARNQVQQMIEDHIDAIGQQTGNEALANELRAANKDYGMSKTIQNMAEDRVNRENANRNIGLTDTIAGGAGAGVGGLIGHAAGGQAGGIEGGLVGGMVGAGINKLGRKYGPAALATGADAVSKGAQATAPYVDATAAAAIQKLMQKNKDKENARP